MPKTALYTNYRVGGLFSIEDQAISTGSRFFVHSGTGSDAAGFGTSPETPAASLDYAIGLCTANKGDVIYVMPGHNEALTAALTVTADVAGVRIVGLGEGADQPRFDYDHASGLFTISAAGVKVERLRFLPSVTGITKAMSIAATDVVVKDCHFMAGEDGSAVDEFTAGIILAAGSDRCKILNNLFDTQPGDASAIGVKLSDASARVEIRGNVFSGAYSTAAVNGITAASTQVVIIDNEMADVVLYAGSTGLVARNGHEVPSWLQAQIGARVGNIFYVNGGSDGPTDNKQNGLSPLTPKQTVTAALAKTVSGNDDYVIVLNYGSNGRAAETWPIAMTKDRVHLIGVSAHEGSKWATVTATGSNKSAVQVTGARCEIANLELGGTSGGSGAGILVGSVGGVWGLLVRGCWFGAADGAGADGVKVASGDDAPYLTVFGCLFGDALTGTGVLIAGNATKAQIGVPGQAANVFRRVPAGIDVTGSAVGVSIQNNRIAAGSDALGKGIKLSAGTTKCFVSGNELCFGKAAAVATLIQDAAGADANDWGINYQDKTAKLTT